MQITKEDLASQRYSVSTLGLWTLQTAFKTDSFKVTSSDMDKVMAEELQHTPYASYVQSDYLFTEDSSFQERYSRASMSGNAIRYGKVIEELDAMAGDCSYKYLLKNLKDENFDPETRPYFLVTVSVDRIDFMNKLRSDQDMRLSAYMLMAKGSTLMVKIDVLQRQNDTSEYSQVGDALIVFVARNAKTGKAF